MKKVIWTVVLIAAGLVWGRTPAQSQDDPCRWANEGCQPASVQSGIRVDCDRPDVWCDDADDPEAEFQARAEADMQDQAQATQAPASTTKPSGSGFTCKDGSHSNATHKQGACSHHGGVAE
jgi:uncharacterized protein DUF3761